MYLSHVMNWYEHERWISYEEDGEEMSQAIKGQEMIIPAKLNVVSGSTMPVSRVQEREEAVVLAQGGFIDQEELLKKMDWPRWKQVVKRMSYAPVSDLMMKLEKMGFPPEILEAFVQVAQMEMKDFDYALEQGDIPTIQELMAPAQDMAAGDPTQQADVEKTMAEVQKIFAEMALIQEKINSEKVEQAVKLAGVEFDEEKLAIERAKIIQEEKIAEKELEVKKDEGGNGDATKTAKKREQGPFIEKGLKSDNKRQ
jgi:hypothetical protein